MKDQTDGTELHGMFKPITLLTALFGAEFVRDFDYGATRFLEHDLVEEKPDEH